MKITIHPDLRLLITLIVPKTFFISVSASRLSLSPGVSRTLISVVGYFILVHSLGIFELLHSVVYEVIVSPIRNCAASLGSGQR
jgi:hypothetical protein